MFKSRIVAVAAGSLILVSLGGVSGAVAASKITSSDIKNQTIQSRDIGKGGVGRSEVRNQSLHSGDIAKGGVGGSELRNHSVQRWDFGKTARTYIKNQAGNGSDGKDGTDGKDGVSGYEVSNREVRWHNGGSNETVVSCTDGKVALGGGYDMSGTANGSPADVHIRTNQPVYDNGVAVGWQVKGSSAGEVNVKTWVTCASMN